MQQVTELGRVESVFKIRFQSAHFQNEVWTFPCDEAGSVNMDALDDAGRRDYLFARLMTRHECATSEVVPATELPSALECAAP